MKKFLILLQIVAFCSILQAQKLINVNPNPTGDPWIAGGFRELTTEEASKIPDLVLPVTLSPVALPSRVSNATSPYFRSIIIQSGGSCSQASGMAYVYTYEVNFMRGIPSKDSVHLYPSHFTYNFLNKGDDNNGSNYTDGWQILKECGIPSIADYGGLYPITDSGWMSGYDKYLRAMDNRVSDYYKIDIGTPAGLEVLKRWLYDHGNGSASGGIACFSAGIANAVMRRIDLGQYESRKRIMKSWSDPVDHAMTFVGYDDSVKFDFNGDKKYTNDIDLNGDSIIDMRDWEIGAMIIANSWGTTWGDTGFIYTPYRNLALKVSEGGISASRAYVVIPRPVYKPEMTLKIKLAHAKRDKLSIRVGISEYSHADKPDFIMAYRAFEGTGGPFPMQGINKDPIELGLDITPLLHQANVQPVKIFLKITENDADTSADGMLYQLSLTDFRNGIKNYSSKDSNLDIVNNGVTLASILLDYPGAPPENLAATPLLKGALLSWNKPADTNGLISYQLFKDGEFYKGCSDTVFTDNFVPNGSTYKVKAVFKSGISSPSNTVIVSNQLHLPVAGSGYDLRYDGLDDCVNCGKGINIANHNFTIEFWAKRLPNASDEFVIGSGTWNKSEEGLHIGFRDNHLMCGFWGDDIQTRKEYTGTEWHHWAITYDTGTKMQTIYVDGAKENSRKAKANYQGSGNWYIGCMKGDTWFYNGEIDEVRVWNYVRTVQQIDTFRFFPLNGNESGLLGYWRFDDRSGDSLRDYSLNSHPGILKNFDSRSWNTSSAWANRIAKTITDTIIVFGGYSKYSHPVKINILDPAVFGTLTIDTAAMKIIYQPSQVFSGKDSFIYSVIDDSLNSEYKLFISPQFPSAIKENPVLGMKVYPNPAYNYIRLDFGVQLSGQVSVELTDLPGKRIIQRNYTFAIPVRELAPLDISQLAGGIYLIRVRAGQSETTLRLVKTP